MVVAEAEQRGSVERILSCNLNSNFTDRSGFDYEVAKEFQKANKGRGSVGFCVVFGGFFVGFLWVSRVFVEFFVGCFCFSSVFEPISAVFVFLCINM